MVVSLRKVADLSLHQVARFCSRSPQPKTYFTGTSIGTACIDFTAPFATGVHIVSEEARGALVCKSSFV
jgi:hypothetical protein